MWNILASSQGAEYIGLVIIVKISHSANFYHFGKEQQIQKLRDGYEKRVIYDYFEKGKENHSKWQLAAIRIRLFFDKPFFTIIVLLIPDKEYGLMDKIKLMRGLKMGEQE